MKHGPNVNKLIAKKIATDMVPSKDSMQGTIQNLMKPGNLQSVARKADEWVTQAIEAVRLAVGPNPWRTATDEEIAEEILRTIADRESQNSKIDGKN